MCVHARIRTVLQRLLLSVMGVMGVMAVMLLLVMDGIPVLMVTRRHLLHDLLLQRLIRLPVHFIVLVIGIDPSLSSAAFSSTTIVNAVAGDPALSTGPTRMTPPSATGVINIIVIITIWVIIITVLVVMIIGHITTILIVIAECTIVTTRTSIGRLHNAVIAYSALTATPFTGPIEAARMLLVIRVNLFNKRRIPVPVRAVC